MAAAEKEDTSNKNKTRINIINNSNKYIKTRKRGYNRKGKRKVGREKIKITANKKNKKIKPVAWR